MMASKMTRPSQVLARGAAKSLVQAMSCRAAPSLASDRMASLRPNGRDSTEVSRPNRSVATQSMQRSVEMPMPASVSMKLQVTTQAPTKSESKMNPTPLMQVESNLFAKLEGFNVGGSIKDRAVMKLVTGMLENGKLTPGDTVAVCTSGNAGRALLHVQDTLAKSGIPIHVKVFMPRRYLEREAVKPIAQVDGVDVIEGDRDTSFYNMNGNDDTVTRTLNGLDGEFMEVQEKMGVLAEEHGWAVLDQHHDINSLHAHQSTAEELLRQLPSLTDVVCSTGTGGTAAGLKHYLPAHVRIHARPGLPGTLDGITDVRRYANFCNTDLLEDYGKEHFDVSKTIANQFELEARYNIVAGQSSGACYGLAKEIAKTDPSAKVIFICADGRSSNVE